MTQFAIDFPTPPSFSAADFVHSACNRLAYDWLMQWPQWSHPAMALSGPPACGKSHLAHIWAQHAQARIIPPQALSDRPETLYAETEALAIDGNWQDWQDEPALFHLLNHVKQEHKALLLVSRTPPARWPVTLPDLASRLKALPHAAIAEADDTLLEALIVKQLADRQLNVTPEVIAFLLRHCERSAGAVQQMVSALDHASLQQGRRITLPFARQILLEKFPSNPAK